MRKLLATILCIGLGYISITAQVIKPEREEKGSLSKDTALVNYYIKITLPFASYQGTLDSAQFYLRKIYDLSEYRKYDQGLAEYYRLLAVVYFTRKSQDSVQMALDNEFYWALQARDPMEMAKAYDLKAWLFQNGDEIDSATQYYIKTLHLVDSLKNYKFAGELYNNLSILFYEIGDSKKSEEYALKGYQTGRQLKDSMLLINCLFNLATAKAAAKEYDSALAIYRQIQQLVRDPLKYNSALIRAWCNEAGIYADQGKNKKAIAKYEGLLQIKEKILPDLLPYIYNGFGYALYREKRLPEAASNINQALTLNRKVNSANARLGLKDSYQYMSLVREAEKQFGEALYYRKQYDSLSDTLLSESMQKNMHLLEVKYNLAQKDKRITQQNLDLTKKQVAIQRKNILMMIIIGSLIALTVIFLLSFRSYRHKRELHHQSILTMQKQHEVDTLKAKMEAREEERNRIGQEMHDDVGSALTTILYLSDDLSSGGKENSKQIAARISQTAGSVVDKMNEIIWSMNNEYDTLDDLIAYTRQQAVEFLENHGLAYNFQAPDAIPDMHLPGEQRRNIYLIIKEALHNTIKHAGATRVDISFQINEKLDIQVRDNGTGIAPDDTRRFGNGLRNMKQRMESVGGTFSIRNEGGTVIGLQCPLEREPS